MERSNLQLLGTRVKRVLLRNGFVERRLKTVSYATNRIPSLSGFEITLNERLSAVKVSYAHTWGQLGYKEEKERDRNVALLMHEMHEALKSTLKKLKVEISVYDDIFVYLPDELSEN